MEVGLALLVSADPVTIQQFSHALEELSISSDVCQEVPDRGWSIESPKVRCCDR
jgi:hypothetical protein